ncbi:MAG: tRNA (guanosine(37)-N1)-methyltransferase TrmD [Acidimicrobiales bacterium]
MTTARRHLLRVDVLTIFPDLVERYVDASLIGKAKESGLVEINALDLRIGATDQHRSVDDAPFGGGAGMVLAFDVASRAIEASKPKRPLYLLSPAGRRFDHDFAQELAELGAFSLLCARYEGADQRIADHLVDGEISLGDFVLAGGELAALCVIEATARLVPGVVGNPASPEQESFSSGLLEYPQYTRPAEYAGFSVPEVLRSGDHPTIARWRRAAALARTIERRPDLIERRGGLSAEEKDLLCEHGYPLGTEAPSASLARERASFDQEEREER